MKTTRPPPLVLTTPPSLIWNRGRIALRRGAEASALELQQLSATLSPQRRDLERLGAYRALCHYPETDHLPLGPWAGARACSQ
ncbi:MAG: hypothetical protein EXR76_15765 [Myxococcales bacterium]|nr:hypothetical protein [Myxococcales bacterium]